MMKLMKNLLMKFGIIIGKQVITEEQKIHEEWYIEAKKMTLNKLPKFINKMANGYRHDYGTICHAMVAGALATLHALNESKQGGITGFQAGAIMWRFIREWNGDKGPLRFVVYDDMLYPQYARKFEKTIDKDTWTYLQEQANEKLKESENRNINTSIDPRVIEHWKSIVDGIVPFGYRISDD